VDRVLGDIFLIVTPNTDYRYPLTPRRPPLSKPQSNSSRRRAAATIQLDLLDSKQQWQGEWGGVGAPVEQSPFMRDWKD